MNWIKYNQPKKLDRRRVDHAPARPSVQACPAPRPGGSGGSRRTATWNRNPDVFRLQLARRMAHPVPRGEQHHQSRRQPEAETPVARRPPTAGRLFASTPKSPAEGQTAGGSNWPERSPPHPATASESSLDTTGRSLLFPDTFPGATGPTPAPAEFHQLYGDGTEELAQQSHTIEDQQHQHQQHQHQHQHPSGDKQRRRHHSGYERERQQLISPEHTTRARLPLGRRAEAVQEHEQQQLLSPNRAARARLPRERRAEPDQEYGRHQPLSSHPATGARLSQQRRPVPDKQQCLSPDRVSGTRLLQERSAEPEWKSGTGDGRRPPSRGDDGLSEERQECLPSTPPGARWPPQEEDIPTVIRPRPTDGPAAPSDPAPGPGRRLEDIIEELLYVPTNTHCTIEREMSDPLYWRAVFPRRRVGLFSPTGVEQQTEPDAHSAGPIAAVQRTDPVCAEATERPAPVESPQRPPPVESPRRPAPAVRAPGPDGDVRPCVPSWPAAEKAASPSGGRTDRPGRQVFDDQWRLIADGRLRRRTDGRPMEPPATPRRLVVELADAGVQTDSPHPVCVQTSSVSVQTSPAAGAP
ncbi:death-inducer obliterator 1-like isoform X1 [Amphibalanus amphitrite]|uniref:death-inducer obliterator 1-like isoform X1 n=1 Tax=Amphibalanus amphitrite TaxID=1232801 RepID=UPI001C8FC1B9|nr:death-inducer obliterator 1-like isoform X1 [Amphibalanus amphitrite]